MTIVNIDDMREAARRRLPKIFFDYIDGGSFSETTLRANRRGFDAWVIEQRVLASGRVPDLATTYLGRRHALPFMLGPVGFLGLYRGRGELLAARAARAAAIPFCLSTFSIASIETLARDGAGAAPGDLQFQLYMLDDEGLNQELLAAATAAGVSTLHLTVDCTVTAIRERDVRNAFRSARRPTPAMLASMLSRPAWLIDLLRHGMPAVEALERHPEFGQGALEQAVNLSRRMDRTLSWAEVDWLRTRWPGRLVIKGVLSTDDALRARDAGADAIVISNHGGRQLDGVASTISVLPRIVEAVGETFEVLLDGGIRRGADIVKALALGASGVLLGRAYAFALAAGGEAGVTRAIDILRTELSVTLALMGLDSIDALKAAGGGVVRRADDPGTGG
ncbi:alpha-hydroxy acid oxidase [Rhodoplanes sp. TEM]|uniref:Alpha-hydroxy acid oxidase n=1 Tax=Rhodoplanes tepidamans TaxID=200616 RepID=A0ABT5J492_RHOTP|nr:MULTISPECIES: alpha-hydroxy acid oxidase [Rhodoplanes]MDC7784433.1 alpha-hydroxy acid oxidase [Rhodoplanes tepidamans]MDC7983463.1 alpha-hydroxy acid oxidase [Rhodoplanes sp. TEM]MDQ0356940.1 isopentenyl diphosphate isomerase/L-lactate dehydrogenase-like FMN-dependent dehydrogenase [Rhodoplanes tepidamans]